MRTRRSRHSKSPNADKPYFDAMSKIFAQAKAHFGSAVKSFWFYESEICPACLKNSIGVVNFNGEEGLALNAFMYRKHGVMIGYLLCDICANFIHAQAQMNPYKETSLHADVEHNLAEAYHKHLSSFN